MLLSACMAMTIILLIMAFKVMLMKGQAYSDSDTISRLLLSILGHIVIM